MEGQGPKTIALVTIAMVLFMGCFAGPGCYFVASGAEHYSYFTYDILEEQEMQDFIKRVNQTLVQDGFISDGQQPQAYFGYPVSYSTPDRSGLSVDGNITVIIVFDLQPDSNIDESQTSGRVDVVLVGEEDWSTRSGLDDDHSNSTGLWEPAIQSVTDRVFTALQTNNEIVIVDDYFIPIDTGVCAD